MIATGENGLVVMEILSLTSPMSLRKIFFSPSNYVENCTKSTTFRPGKDMEDLRMTESPVHDLRLQSVTKRGRMPTSRTIPNQRIWHGACYPCVLAVFAR